MKSGRKKRVRVVGNEVVRVRGRDLVGLVGLVAWECLAADDVRRNIDRKVVLGLYKVVMVELRDQMLLLYCSTASNTTSRYEKNATVFNVVVVLCAIDSAEISVTSHRCLLSTCIDHLPPSIR